MAPRTNRIVWISVRRTVRVHCTDCDYAELDGSVTLARDHITEHPDHLVQFSTIVQSEMFRPGRRDIDDGEPTDQLQTRALRAVA